MSQQAVALEHEQDPSTSLVSSELTFMSRDPRWEEEKPYSMRYAPSNDFPVTNFMSETHRVEIRSIRDMHPAPSLQTTGFEVHRLNLPMTRTDFDDYDTVRTTYIRKRAPHFPLSAGRVEQFAQPATQTHIDLTLDGAREIIKEVYGDRASLILEAPFQVVTVWKPLVEPVRDWPLAVCDTRSVDFMNDVINSDVVYPQQFSENAMIFHNANMQWYYLPNQLANEVLIFKAADSSCPTMKGCPHGSFMLPNVEDIPRQSIDLRILVMHADIEYGKPKPWDT
ncbi:Hypothetical protein D9617_10g071870 [Elsinoe fawcettii]|nr:Hypothetical protein D9617_10g071870 [Elsinoe fawcettii]